MNEIMKNISGNILVLVVKLLYMLLPLFMSKDKTTVQIGKILTKISVLSLSTLIPKVKTKSDFNVFRKKIKKGFALSKVLYDYKIIEDNEKKIQFEIHSCPFTGALKSGGYEHLCKYVCAGDFVIAKRNKEKWLFKREHSLGTTGKYCNHAYFNINE
jgi:hypothetical protein